MLYYSNRSCQHQAALWSSSLHLQFHWSTFARPGCRFYFRKTTPPSKQGLREQTAEGEPLNERSRVVWLRLFPSVAGATPGVLQPRATLADDATLRTAAIVRDAVLYALLSACVVLHHNKEENRN